MEKVCLNAVTCILCPLYGRTCDGKPEHPLDVQDIPTTEGVLMINSNYKAIVYGKYLSEKTKRIKGHMCIVKKFYFKTAMVNWAREQINMPNTKPTCVQFFVKKNHVWELKAKVQVKIPINQRKKRTLIWGGQYV